MAYDSPAQQEIQNQVMQMMGVISIILIVALIVGVLIWWNIFSKAGFSGARSLLLFIPIVNIIIFLMFAFGEWPVRRELAALRQENAALRQQLGGPSNPAYPYNQPQ